MMQFPGVVVPLNIIFSSKILYKNPMEIRRYMYIQSAFLNWENFACVNFHAYVFKFRFYLVIFLGKI